MLAALAGVLAIAAYLNRVPLPRRAAASPICKTAMPEHAHAATHHLRGHQHAANHAAHVEHRHSQQQHEHHVHDDLLPIEFETLAIEIPHEPAEILKQDAFDAPAAATPSQITACDSSS
jgi:hypothetical protein